MVKPVLKYSDNSASYFITALLGTFTVFTADNDTPSSKGRITESPYTYHGSDCGPPYFYSSDRLMDSQQLRGVSKPSLGPI